METLKRLVTILAALLLAVGISMAVTAPASAAVSTKICNSSDSTKHQRIKVWITDSSAVYYVSYGTCGPWLSNNDTLRVDTCPDAYTIAGYWVKSDSGYGPFHSGCKWDSNPPNYDGNVYYKLKA